MELSDGHPHNSHKPALDQSRGVWTYSSRRSLSLWKENDHGRKNKCVATEGSNDAVMPKAAADLAKTGQDLNAISETTDGDGQHKLKNEVKDATDLPEKGWA